MKSWEELCRRCGQCCYEKERTPRGVVTLRDQPCEFLDPATRLCRVYADRFRLCPRCRRMTLPKALFLSYLPAGCGYVRAFRIWRRSSRCRPPG